MQFSKKQKTKYLIIGVFTLAFGIVWVLNIFMNYKNVSNLQHIHFIIYPQDNNVKLSGITLKNDTVRFLPDSTGLWLIPNYSKRVLKEVIIVDSVSAIDSAMYCLTNKDYQSINSLHFKKAVLKAFPDKKVIQLKQKNSILPQYNNSINWAGDIRLVFKHFGRLFIIVACLCILTIEILFK